MQKVVGSNPISRSSQSQVAVARMLMVSDAVSTGTNGETTPPA